MPQINVESILAKAGKYVEQPAMQTKIEKFVDDAYLGTGDAAISHRPAHTPEDAADRFCSVLRSEIDDSAAGKDGNFKSGKLGNTAVAALKELDYGKAHKESKYKYSIGVYFENDLHRDSLDEERYPEGVNNIAALLNRGYHARHSVKGVWRDDDRVIWSLPRRVGAGFIDRAISNFYGNYAADYGVLRVDADEEYNI